MEIDPTSSTIVTQQFKAYKRRGINCHPRAWYLHELRNFILDQQLLDNSIIMGIDANLDRPTDTLFQEMMDQCNLIDIIKYHHGNPTPI